MTKPYTDKAWTKIVKLGELVDKRLVDDDVRLTVGGEPTFVSIDNQVDPEWTTDADGPHKRERASVLTARLKSVWAPHGLVQYGQGKWYPGEPLPRWQIALHWRRDGKPLWNDAALFGRPWGATGPSVETDKARQVLTSIATALRLLRPGPARIRRSAVPAVESRSAAGRSAGRTRRRPRSRRAGQSDRIAGTAGESGRRSGCVGVAAAPPRRRLRLGQCQLAAAAGPDRAARRRLTGRPSPAAGLDQLAAATNPVSR